MRVKTIGAALVFVGLAACSFSNYEEVLQEPNAEIWNYFTGATTAPDGSVVLVRNQYGGDHSNIATYQNGRLISSHDIEHWHENIDRAVDGTYWINASWDDDTGTEYIHHYSIMERWSIPVNGTPKLLARLDLGAEWFDNLISITDFAAGRQENVLYVMGQSTKSQAGAIVKYTLEKVAQAGVDTYRIASRRSQKLRSDNLDPLVISSWPDSFESSNIAVDQTSGQVYVTVSNKAMGGGVSLLTYNEDLSRNDTDALERPNIFDLYASHGVVGFLSGATLDSATKLEVVQDTGTSWAFWDTSNEVAGVTAFAVDEFDTAKQNCAYVWVPGIHSKSGSVHKLFGKHTFCGDKTQ